MLGILLILSPRIGLSSSSENQLPLQDFDRDLYFDAGQSTYDRNTNIQYFSGEVVAITAHSLIAADKVTLDREKHLLVADGHVIIASPTQILTGEHVEVNLRTKEFSISKAIIVNQEPIRSKEIIDQVLGITSKEIQFGISQQQQLATINEQKNTLIKQYLDTKKSGGEEKPIVDRYALLLRQEQNIATQSYLDYLPLSPQQKSIIAQRRAFWQKQYEPNSAIESQNIGYFRLEGEHIQQIENRHLLAKHGLFTPCLCHEDSPPAWGFRASHIDAQMGGYADLKNSVLEIKGVPVFYFPYLKFPLKSRRQSGFLFPEVSYHSRDGNILSSPLYLALSPRSDSTITTTFIEKRGWRLGVEYRLQTDTYSGLRLNVEGIRDQTWLSSLAAHKAYRSRYTELTPQDQLSDTTLAHLFPPPNLWRGKATWQGLTILTPSTSLVSEGALTSDHRYDNDFWYKYYVDSPSPLRPAFAKAGALLHVDTSNFYSGVSTQFADHTLSNTSFAGQQIPTHLSVQSRYFTFPLNVFYFPIYGQVAADYYKFHLVPEKKPSPSTSSTVFAKNLKSGDWFGTQLRAVAPLTSKQAVQVNLFSEFDARLIYTERPQFADGAPLIPDQHDNSESSIQSLRTGLMFRLPLNGYYLLSSKHEDHSLSGATIFRTFEHAMNWDVILSLRPATKRRGSYGENYALASYTRETGQWQDIYHSEPLTYFASDSSYLYDSPLIPEERTMTPHSKIIFRTDHRWFLREKQLKNSVLEQKTSQKSLSNPSEATEPANWQEQARQDLDEALAAIKTRRMAEERYFSHSSQAEVMRNLRVTNEVMPLAWNSQINYDYRKEQERTRQKRLNSELSAGTHLPEPWSPWSNSIGFSWQNWNLGFSGEYNIYQKVTTQTTLSLQFPTVLSLSLGLLYKIEKEYQPLPAGGFGYFPRNTREVSLNSTLIPALPMQLRYGETRRETASGELPKEYLAAIAATYYASSQCWGLKASWEKDYIETDWAGTYYLGLVVNFFNVERNIGNLVSRVNQPEVK